MRWWCGLIAYTPLGGSTEGAHQSWCPASHQGDSSSVTVTMLPDPVSAVPVVKTERIVRSVMVAAMASPAPLVINSRYRARSAVGRAQGLVSQGSGFDPDLFHKACYMPFTCRWRFEIKLGIFF